MSPELPRLVRTWHQREELVAPCPDCSDVASPEDLGMEFHASLCDAVYRSLLPERLARPGRDDGGEWRRTMMLPEPLVHVGSETDFVSPRIVARLQFYQVEYAAFPLLRIGLSGITSLAPDRLSGQQVKVLVGDVGNGLTFVGRALRLVSAYAQSPDQLEEGLLAHPKSGGGVNY